jgi:hypothetical protein
MVTLVAALAELSMPEKTLVLCEAVLVVMMTSDGALEKLPAGPLADDEACSTPELKIRPARSSGGVTKVTTIANSVGMNFRPMPASVCAVKIDRPQAYDRSNGKQRKSSLRNKNNDLE